MFISGVESTRDAINLANFSVNLLSFRHRELQGATLLEFIILAFRREGLDDGGQEISQICGKICSTFSVVQGARDVIASFA